MLNNIKKYACIVLMELCWKLEDILDYFFPNNSVDISAYFEIKVYGYKSLDKPMNIKAWYSRAEETNYWGSIDGGWTRLVSNLCKNIIELDGTVRILQVKEKFGSLRFYIVPGKHKKYRKQINDLIYLAERTSSGICEICGSFDFVSVGNSVRLKALCYKCRKIVEG